MRIRIALVAAMMLTAMSARADVSLVGTLKERALLSVNGGAPRTFPVGATLPDGSRLVGVTSGEATIEDGGKRYTIRLGEFAASKSNGGGNSMVLSPDMNGHYSVAGEINGFPVNMMLDTCRAGRQDGHRLQEQRPPRLYPDGGRHGAGVDCQTG
jgi:aspartyl protease family protein